MRDPWPTHALARLPPLDLRVATRADATGIAQLLAQCCHRDEPLIASLRLPADPVREYFEALVHDVADDALSLCAFDAVEGRLAGAILVRDFCTTLTCEVGDRHPLLRPCSEFLSGMEREFDALRAPRAFEVAHVLAAATHASLRGRHIYTWLRRSAHVRAYELGRARVLGEATVRASQHVLLDRFGHRMVLERRFEDFELDGRRPFAQAGLAGSCLMIEGDLKERVQRLGRTEPTGRPT